MIPAVTSAFESTTAIRREARPAPAAPLAGIAPSAAVEEQLTEAEKRQVQELQRRDREVRAHEHAHVAAGGALVRGGANFSYAFGPDGERYAVGGEVTIDTGRAGTHEETIAKMRQVRAAALAPANPSAQDYSVATQAARLAMEARQELRQETPGTVTEARGGGTVAARYAIAGDEAPAPLSLIDIAI